MIPEPSKRPFGHPLPLAALLYLVHPKAGHQFAKPFRDASGNVVTYNGALAVRIRSFLPDDIDVAPMPWEAVENSLHWPIQDADKDPANAGRWKALDDESGRIWRFPPRAAWIRCRDGIKGNTFATLRVGAATVVPLALLQLCARLPRCRVRIDGGEKDHLQFVWNGGEAVIRPIADLVAPSFGIHSPKRDLWTKDFTYGPR